MSFSIYHLVVALKRNARYLLHLGLLALKLSEKMKRMVKDIEDLYREMELIKHQFVCGKFEMRKLSQVQAFGTIFALKNLL